jgi:hypothetical protein
VDLRKHDWNEEHEKGKWRIIEERNRTYQEKV